MPKVWIPAVKGSSSALLDSVMGKERPGFWVILILQGQKQMEHRAQGKRGSLKPATAAHASLWLKQHLDFPF